MKGGINFAMESEKLDKIITLLGEIKNKSNKDYSFDIHNAIMEGIDHAVNGHRGLMDGTDLDRMEKDRKEEDVIRKQIDNLYRQTFEIKRQTKYIIAAFVLTLFTSIVTIVFSYLNYKIAEGAINAATNQTSVLDTEILRREGK